MKQSKVILEFTNTDKSTPESGKRVCVILDDGRVCSGLVTKTGGFEIEYIDGVDLLEEFVSPKPIKWAYLPE